MSTLPTASRTLAAVTALLAALTFPATALAWGDRGHTIVAHLATRMLAPDTSQEVAELLAQGETLESVASWADGLRGSRTAPGIRPETVLWHFVDIPLGKVYDAARDCPDTPNGSCVISAVVIFQDVLAKRRPGYYTNSRYEALKFMVHFVGDLHQPLHCVDDNDAGGNFKKIVWFDDRIENLHAVWDEEILAESMKRQSIADPAAYADQLFAQLTPAQRKEAEPTPSTKPTVLSRATVEGWAKAAHAIASGAYADLGPKGPDTFYRPGPAYYDHHRAEVDEQLKRAGIRLARILNETLR